MRWDKDVVVVGAGISGLAVAHTLAGHGRDVTLIERDTRVGGRMHTEARGGFLLEHGPNALIAPAAGAETLIAAAGLTEQRIMRGAEVRHRYLARDGHLHALPIDPAGFFLSSFFTLRGRLRLLAEPFITARHDDESIAAFIRRRFGRELLDYVFDPLVGGLYAGDPERLSIDAVFPHLKAMERNHGSVLRGVLARHRLGRAFDPQRRSLFSLRHGLGSLPAALAQGLGLRVLTGTRLDAISPLPDGGFRLRLSGQGRDTTLSAAQVVLALPAYAAARVLAPLDDTTAARLAGIDHPPLAVAFLGYRRDTIEHPLDGLGALMPKAEKRDVLGMLFSSTLFNGRAPQGHALLTAYVGGTRQPDLAGLPREELLQRVEHEARDLLGARAAPVLRHVRYWQRCLPQPGMDHAQCIAAVRALEQQWPGLHITGNYLGGVSTVACIDAAMTTAERVMVQGMPRRTDGMDDVTAGRPSVDVRAS
nr:protoporphyrinogen oxidase [Sulfurivermis fontis]